MNGKRIEEIEKELAKAPLDCTNCRLVFQKMLEEIKQAYYEIDQLTSYIHGRDR
jgi:hypothetical protein